MCRATGAGSDDALTSVRRYAVSVWVRLEGATAAVVSIHMAELPSPISNPCGVLLSKVRRPSRVETPNCLGSKVTKAVLTFLRGAEVGQTAAIPTRKGAGDGERGGERWRRGRGASRGYFGVTLSLCLVSSFYLPAGVLIVFFFISHPFCFVLFVF